MPYGSQVLFQIIAEVVSFDFFAPTDFITINFTETLPFGANYEGLGYDNLNCIENLGSILLIAILLIARQVFTALAYTIAHTSCCCKCSRRFTARNQTEMKDVTNSWLRFVLETYFELIIASFIGFQFIRTVPINAYTRPDMVSVKTNIFVFAICVSFFLMTIVLTLYCVRTKIRHDKEIAYDSIATRRLQNIRKKEQYQHAIEFGPQVFFQKA